MHVPYRTWCKRSKTVAPRDLTSHLAAIKERGYEEKESYEVKGVINVTYPVLDEHGYAVAALTVPYIRRIGDNTTMATVRQALKRASSTAFARNREESRVSGRNWTLKPIESRHLLPIRN